MKLPATAVFIHHSVTPITNDPAADMRIIETIGLQRFGQFSYSYCVHPRDGEVLEGCGIRRGAHTSNRNSTSFGICWVGNYEERAPKVQQIDATRWLIAELKKEGHLAADATVFGHRDVYSTACPGSKLYALLGDIRKPWVATTPQSSAPPVLTAGQLLEVDGMQLRQLSLNVPLDDKGKGWTPIPYAIDRVVSYMAHSGTRPAADGGYDGDPDKVGVTPEDDHVLVVVQGGNPGGTAPVWVTVIEN